MQVLARDLAGRRFRATLSRLDPASLVRLRLSREPSPAVVPLLGAETLRRVAPASMTVSVAWRGALDRNGHDDPE